MNITTEQIKNLRDATGVSVMQCKKALEEAEGDLEKAKIILRKISKQSADKKAGRSLGAGTVASYIHSNGTVGAMVELLCETDFVARNEDFKTLARDITMHITAMDPENLEELLNQEFIKSPDKTIKNLIEEAIQKFGEKTEIGRFVRFSIK
jgi:elongation factor Ts